MRDILMSMFKKTTFVFFISAFLFLGCGRKESRKIYFKQDVFTVEVAKDQKQYGRGLMFRKQIPADGGMLFIFRNEARRYFYMKNMLIPLDMIWLNKDKKVIWIKKNAQPEGKGYYEVIDSGQSVQYVLEVNAGTADRIGLKAGDRLNFED